jgi:hypothetical protein
MGYGSGRSAVIWRMESGGNVDIDADGFFPCSLQLRRHDFEHAWRWCEPCLTELLAG